MKLPGKNPSAEAELKSSKLDVGGALPEGIGKRILRRMGRAEVLGLAGVYVLLVLFLSTATRYFLTVDNVSNLLREMSVLGIVAAGQTLVMIRGKIDLSVGAIVAVSSIMAALAEKAGWPAIVVVLVALAGGTIFGLVNGAVIAKWRVNALVVTLGTMTVGYGITLVLTGGAPQSIRMGVLEIVGQQSLGFIPYQFIAMISVVILVFLVLRFTVFGRSIYAAGDNEQAAVLNGIDVDRVTIIVFVIAGLMAAVGGLLLAGQFTTADPLIGREMNLKSIAAAVIGGVSLFGGIGGIGGTVLGAALMATLANGLVQLHTASAWQEVATGIVIVAAVLFDQLRTRGGGQD